MTTNKTIPTKFSSIEEMHRKGFLFASEIPKVEIKQLWVDEAEAQGISLPELARMAGLHRQSLYAAKAGTTQLSLESAFRICFALGISMEQAFVVNKETMYSKCMRNGVYIYIDPRTLKTLPESKWRKLRGTPEYNLIQCLYHSLF